LFCLIKPRKRPSGTERADQEEACHVTESRYRAHHSYCSGCDFTRY
jgi:hypothetical protein